MSRPSKDGKKARGIQAKNGYLYVTMPNNYVKDNKKIYGCHWIPTHLRNTPENVKKAIEIRNELKHINNLPQINKSITLSEYIDQFLAKKKAEVSDTTYSGYENKAKYIIRWYKDIRIKDVNEEMVKEFLDSLFTDNGLQLRTVKDVKVEFKRIMNNALKDGFITENPVNDVKINMQLAALNAKPEDPDSYFFSYAEAITFLDIIKNHDFYEIFYVTLFFALRRSEVLGIKWSAVDLVNKKLLINHTVTKGTVITRKNKAKNYNSIRPYPLTDEQVAMFRSLKEREEQNRLLCGKSYIENDYVFKNKDGSLYYPDTITKKFNEVIKANKVLPQMITLHGLRRSCVSILVHLGMDIKSIQSWVGHKDIKTTLNIYAKVKEREAKEEVSKKLDSILPSKKDND